MSLPIRRSDTFVVDVASQFAWYLENADESIAWRFVDAVDATLTSLALHPEQGRARNFRDPRLLHLRSFRVDLPFERILIFYRPTEDALHAWRLMSGTRDLPHRLAE